MSTTGSHIVHVATEDRLAFSQPAFLIKADGKYYATLAVLEYDPAAEGLSDEQKRDIASIAELYERLLQSDRLSTGAAGLKDVPITHFIQSGPRR